MLAQTTVSNSNSNAPSVVFGIRPTAGVTSLAGLGSAPPGPGLDRPALGTVIRMTVPEA